MIVNLLVVIGKFQYFSVPCRYVVKRSWIKRSVEEKFLLEFVKKQATKSYTLLGKKLIICIITTEF